MPKLFKKKHYAAFMPPKPDIDTPAVRLERVEAQKCLLWLDDQLAPFIQAQGWDLHRHRQAQHYTSSTHFVWINPQGDTTDDGSLPGKWQPIVNHIAWLWLHYGKSKAQLDVYKNLLGAFQHTHKDDSDYYNAFYAHTRIQFYLSHELFGVWLLYTDKNRFDKSEFLRGLLKQPNEDDFWNRLQPLLGEGFQYLDEANETSIDLVKKVSRKELFKLIRGSSKPGYSGIRKIYTPDDPLLDEENIVEEMKKNLTLLYPLYIPMSFRQQVTVVPKAPAPGTDLSNLFGGNVRVKKGRKK